MAKALNNKRKISSFISFAMEIDESLPKFNFHELEWKLLFHALQNKMILLSLMAPGSGAEEGGAKKYYFQQKAFIQIRYNQIISFRLNSCRSRNASQLNQFPFYLWEILYIFQNLLLLFHCHNEVARIIYKASV